MVYLVFSLTAALMSVMKALDLSGSMKNDMKAFSLSIGKKERKSMSSSRAKGT